MPCNRHGGSNTVRKVSVNFAVPVPASVESQLLAPVLTLLGALSLLSLSLYLGTSLCLMGTTSHLPARLSKFLCPLRRKVRAAFTKLPNIGALQYLQEIFKQGPNL